MSGQHTSRRLYYLVFLTLMMLTATTVGVTFLDLGPGNVVLALLIAFTKATLVVLFFMHVKTSSALTKVFVASGLLWFAILLTLTFSDYISRTWLTTPQGW